MNGQYQTSDEEEIRKECYRLSFRWTGWLGQDGCYRLQVSQDPKFQTIAAECVTEEPQGSVEVGNSFSMSGYAGSMERKWGNGQYKINLLL